MLTYKQPTPRIAALASLDCSALAVVCLHPLPASAPHLHDHHDPPLPEGRFPLFRVICGIKGTGCPGQDVNGGGK
jgi:hypothetical protein